MQEVNREDQRKRKSEGEKEQVKTFCKGTQHLASKRWGKGGVWIASICRSIKRVLNSWGTSQAYGVWRRQNEGFPVLAGK